MEPFWASGTKLAEMPFWYQKPNSVVKYISCTLYPNTCRSVFNKRVINPNGPLNYKILMNFDNHKTQELHRNFFLMGKLKMLQIWNVIPSKIVFYCLFSDVMYGSIVTIKQYRTGGAYLHSHWHLYPEGVGARQQQVCHVFFIHCTIQLFWTLNKKMTSRRFTFTCWHIKWHIWQTNQLIDLLTRMHSSRMRTGRS